MEKEMLGNDTTESMQEQDSEDEASEQGPSNSAQPDSDLYGYVDRVRTHEAFKLHVSGYPRHTGYGGVKKKLAKRGVRPAKMKLLDGQQEGRAFLAFKSKVEVDAAFNIINAMEWKGKKMSATYAAPAVDPFVKVHQTNASSEGTLTKGGIAARIEAARSITDLEARERELGQLLRESVEPWHSVDYSEQLARKRALCAAAIKAYMPTMKSDDYTTLAKTIPSPITEQYRNKVEFTIGFDIDNKPAVGFRVGAYHQGSVVVVRAKAGSCKIIPDNFCAVASAFEEFLVKSSQFQPFDSHTHLGQYKKLVVRGNTAGEILLVADLSIVGDRLSRSDDEIKADNAKALEERSRLHDFFACSNPELRVVGLLWTDDAGNTESNPIQIFGTCYLEEMLMGVHFRIGSASFFQVNTAAAAFLYTEIHKFVFKGEDKPRLVLDVCCGTGTIGIILMALEEGKSDFEVRGIESCRMAIDDAKANAVANNKKITYTCAKVEQVMPSIVKCIPEGDYRSNPIVAVLDPPRAGVHAAVTSSLRRTEAVKRIVFAACNPKQASVNFEQLVRPCSRRKLSPPFKLVKAVPVDMFPHTEHCELVMLFERD